MTELSDIDLVRKVKEGEILAYEVLVRRYEMKLLRYLKRWNVDESVAEEVVQDALFKVYKSIGKIDESRGFSPYLYTTAKNELMNRFRKEKMVLPLIEEVVGIDGEKMYEELHRKNIQSMVRQSLDSLKEKQRHILELYFFEELSYKKIGEKLGMPLNTIKTNIRRAKAALLSKFKHEKK